MNAMLWGMGSVICLHPDLHPSAHIHPMAQKYFGEDILSVPASAGDAVDIEALRQDWLVIAGDFRHVYEQEIAEIKA